MKLSTHLLLQFLMLIVQYGNLASGLVPANTQKWVMLGVALAQAGLGWYNHNFNPDGTAAAVAYVKK